MSRRSDLKNKVSSWLSAAWNAISWWVDAVKNAAWNATFWVVEWAKELAKDFWDTLRSDIKDLNKTWWEVANDFWNIIKPVFDWIRNVSDTVWWLIDTNVEEMKIVSSDLNELENPWNFAQRLPWNIANIVADMWLSTAEWFQSLWKWIDSLGKKMYQDVKDWFDPNIKWDLYSQNILENTANDFSKFKEKLDPWLDVLWGVSKVLRAWTNAVADGLKLQQYNNDWTLEWFWKTVWNWAVWWTQSLINRPWDLLGVIPNINRWLQWDENAWADGIVQAFNVATMWAGSAIAGMWKSILASTIWKEFAAKVIPEVLKSPAIWWALWAWIKALWVVWAWLSQWITPLWAIPFASVSTNEKRAWELLWIKNADYDSIKIINFQSSNNSEWTVTANSFNDAVKGQWWNYFAKTDDEAKQKLKEFNVEWNFENQKNALKNIIENKISWNPRSSKFIWPSILPETWSVDATDPDIVLSAEQKEAIKLEKNLLKIDNVTRFVNESPLTKEYNTLLYTDRKLWSVVGAVNESYVIEASKLAQTYMAEKDPEKKKKIWDLIQQNKDMAADMVKQYTEWVYNWKQISEIEEKLLGQYWWKMWLSKEWIKISWSWNERWIVSSLNEYVDEKIVYPGFWSVWWYEAVGNKDSIGWDTKSFFIRNLADIFVQLVVEKVLNTWFGALAKTLWGTIKRWNANAVASGLAGIDEQDIAAATEDYLARNIKNIIEEYWSATPKTAITHALSKWATSELNVWSEELANALTKKVPDSLYRQQLISNAIWWFLKWAFDEWIAEWFGFFVADWRANYWAYDFWKALKNQAIEWLLWWIIWWSMWAAGTTLAKVDLQTYATIINMSEWNLPPPSNPPSNPPTDKAKNEAEYVAWIIAWVKAIWSIPDETDVTVIKDAFDKWVKEWVAAVREAIPIIKNQVVTVTTPEWKVNIWTFGDLSVGVEWKKTVKTLNDIVPVVAFILDESEKLPINSENYNKNNQNQKIINEVTWGQNKTTEQFQAQIRENAKIVDTDVYVVSKEVAPSPVDIDQSNNTGRPNNPVNKNEDKKLIYNKKTKTVTKDPWVTVSKDKKKNIVIEVKQDPWFRVNRVIDSSWVVHTRQWEKLDHVYFVTKEKNIQWDTVWMVNWEETTLDQVLEDGTKYTTVVKSESEIPSIEANKKWFIFIPYWNQLSFINTSYLWIISKYPYVLWGKVENGIVKLLLNSDDKAQILNDWTVVLAKSEPWVKLALAAVNRLNNQNELIQTSIENTLALQKDLDGLWLWEYSYFADIFDIQWIQANNKVAIVNWFINNNRLDILYKSNIDKNFIDAILSYEWQMRDAKILQWEFGKDIAADYPDNAFLMSTEYQWSLVAEQIWFLGNTWLSNILAFAKKQFKIDNQADPEKERVNMLKAFAKQMKSDLETWDLSKILQYWNENIFNMFMWNDVTGYGDLDNMYLEYFPDRILDWKIIYDTEKSPVFESVMLKMETFISLINKLKLKNNERENRISDVGYLKDFINWSMFLDKNPEESLNNIVMNTPIYKNIVWEINKFMEWLNKLKLESVQKDWNFDISYFKNFINEVVFWDRKSSWLINKITQDTPVYKKIVSRMQFFIKWINALIVEDKQKKTAMTLEYFQNFINAVIFWNRKSVWLLNINTESDVELPEKNSMKFLASIDNLWTSTTARNFYWSLLRDWITPSDIKELISQNSKEYGEVILRMQNFIKDYYDENYVWKPQSMLKWFAKQVKQNLESWDYNNIAKYWTSQPAKEFRDRANKGSKKFNMPNEMQDAFFKQDIIVPSFEDSSLDTAIWDFMLYQIWSSAVVSQDGETLYDQDIFSEKWSEFAQKLINSWNTVSLIYRWKEYISAQAAYDKQKIQSKETMADIIFEKLIQNKFLIDWINERWWLDYVQNSMWDEIFLWALYDAATRAWIVNDIQKKVPWLSFSLDKNKFIVKKEGNLVPIWVNIIKLQDIIVKKWDTLRLDLTSFYHDSDWNLYKYSSKAKQTDVYEPIEYWQYTVWDISDEWINSWLATVTPKEFVDYLVWYIQSSLNLNQSNKLKVTIKKDAIDNLVIPPEINPQDIRKLFSMPTEAYNLLINNNIIEGLPFVWNGIQKNIQSVLMWLYSAWAKNNKWERIPYEVVESLLNSNIDTGEILEDISLINSMGELKKSKFYKTVYQPLDQYAYSMVREKDESWLVTDKFTPVDPDKGALDMVWIVEPWKKTFEDGSFMADVWSAPLDVLSLVWIIFWWDDILTPTLWLTYTPLYLRVKNKLDRSLAKYPLLSRSVMWMTDEWWVIYEKQIATTIFPNQVASRMFNVDAASIAKEINNQWSIEYETALNDQTSKIIEVDWIAWSWKTFWAINWIVSQISKDSNVQSIFTSQTNKRVFELKKDFIDAMEKQWFDTTEKQQVVYVRYKNSENLVATIDFRTNDSLKFRISKNNDYLNNKIIIVDEAWMILQRDIDALKNVNTIQKLIIMWDKSQISRETFWWADSENWYKPKNEIVLDISRRSDNESIKYYNEAASMYFRKYWKHRNIIPDNRETVDSYKKLWDSYTYITTNNKDSADINNYFLWKDPTWKKIQYIETDSLGKSVALNEVAIVDSLIKKWRIVVWKNNLDWFIVKVWNNKIFVINKWIWTSNLNFDNISKSTATRIKKELEVNWIAIWWYAFTAFKVQWDTFDNVAIINNDWRKPEVFYSAATRARKDVKIIWANWIISSYTKVATNVLKSITQWDPIPVDIKIEDIVPWYQIATQEFVAKPETRMDWFYWFVKYIQSKWVDIDIWWRLEFETDQEYIQRYIDILPDNAKKSLPQWIRNLFWIDPVLAKSNIWKISMVWPDFNLTTNEKEIKNRIEFVSRMRNWKIKNSYLDILWDIAILKDANSFYKLLVNFDSISGYFADPKKSITEILNENKSILSQEEYDIIKKLIDEWKIKQAQNLIDWLRVEFETKGSDSISQFFDDEINSLWQTDDYVAIENLSIEAIDTINKIILDQNNTDSIVYEYEATKNSLFDNC